MKNMALGRICDLSQGYSFEIDNNQMIVISNVMMWKWHLILCINTNFVWIKITFGVLGGCIFLRLSETFSLNTPGHISKVGGSEF